MKPGRVEGWLGGGGHVDGLPCSQEGVKIIEMQRLQVALQPVTQPLNAGHVFTGSENYQ